MKSLREHARRLNDELNRRRSCVQGGYPVDGSTTDLLEAFAREIRNEALEESANKFDEYYKIKGPDVAIMIRALKTAKESEK